MTFETGNGTDEAGARDKLLQTLHSVEVAYDPKDVENFFIILETVMAYSGIKSQEAKRFGLLYFLPKEVKTQLKGVMIATATHLKELGYKILKNAVLDAFGPKPREFFAKTPRLILAIAKINFLEDQELMKCLQNNKTLYLNFDLNQNSWGKYNAKLSSQVERANKAALVIQSNWKMAKQRRAYQSLKIKIIKLQSFARMVSQRTRYLKTRKAALLIQRSFRATRDRHVFLQ